MATVINNPAPADRRDVVYSDSADHSGVGFVVGVIVAIILGILLLAYAIPAIRNASRTGGTNITTPSASVNGASAGGSGSTGTGSGGTGTTY